MQRIIGWINMDKHRLLVYIGHFSRTDRKKQRNSEAQHEIGTNLSAEMLCSISIISRLTYAE